LLSARGAAVTVASSGEEALHAIEHGRFDVLVSDIGMPGMDGYALIRKLRAEKRRERAELPAIALTAFARADDRVRALTAGFQSHLSKPVDGEQLVAAVASAHLGSRHGPC
jgi:CheY-like chemotaxis protein